MSSAKDKIDFAVAQKQLASAKQVIQAQDTELSSLRSKLATDARRTNKPRVLRPVHPCHSTQLEYRQKLECLIDKMNQSVLYWLKAAFKANEPEVTALAQDSVWQEVIPGDSSDPDPSKWTPARFEWIIAKDALPATALRKAIRKLSRRWQRDFNEASWDLARWFSLRAHKRSTKQLHSILKKGGWTVEMQMSPAQRDILHATINENVSLIKSIPAQYFTQIEGMVMRSVQTGRDLHQLTGDLQKQYRVTRRRAELIARDQNNKASASMTRAKQIELGITEAVWVHSGGGKHPRPTHVKNNGQKFDVREGWYDPAVRKKIWPGTEINCRCISRSVIAGFS